MQRPRLGVCVPALCRDVLTSCGESAFLHGIALEKRQGLLVLRARSPASSRPFRLAVPDKVLQTGKNPPEAGFFLS